MSAAIIIFTLYVSILEPRERSRYSDSLRVGRSGNRIPVGARFFAPIQTDSEDHPPSCTMGTGSFPGARRPGRGADHPLPSGAEVHKKE